MNRAHLLEFISIGKKSAMIRINIKLNSSDTIQESANSINPRSVWSQREKKQHAKLIERLLKRAEKLPEQLLRALKQCERGKHKVAYESTGAITRSFRI